MAKACAEQMRKAMHGTSAAAQNWAYAYTALMVSLGFKL